MSTSMLDSASTSADGFIWSISGQASAPAPTASVDQVTSSRKSRRVVPSAAWRTESAVSAMRESPMLLETETFACSGNLCGGARREQATFGRINSL